MATTSPGRAGTPAGRRFVSFLFFLAATLSALAFARSGVPEGAPELEVRAAYLFNIARYVTWPETALPPERPLVLCVMGDDAFAEALLRVARAGKTVQSRSLEVRTIVRPAEGHACHVLYFGGASGDRVLHTMAVVNSRPVLTVSRQEDGVAPGAAVRLFTEGPRLRFLVDLRVVRRSGLVLSSQLLQLAVVKGEDGKERR